MKTVTVDKNYQFKLGPRAHIQYLAGETYQRVTEAQVKAIIAAGAGRVVDDMSGGECRTPR